MIELEYVGAMMGAELDWVRSVTGEVRAGTLPPVSLEGLTSFMGDI